MAKRRKTAIQRQYEKEYRNLQRRINRIENKGYVVEGILPDKLTRPNKKSIENLKKIKAPQIYGKSKGIDLETGEIISAKERQKIDRKKSADKAKETRRQRKENVPRETFIDIKIEPPKEVLPPLPSYSGIIVGNFKAEMARMPGDNGNRIIGLINNLINQEGVDSVATMLEEANNAGKMPSYGFLASGQEDLVIDAIAEMLEFLPDVSDTLKRDIVEEFEYYEGGY